MGNFGINDLGIGVAARAILSILIIWISYLYGRVKFSSCFWDLFLFRRFILIWRFLGNVKSSSSSWLHKFCSLIISIFKIRSKTNISETISILILAAFIALSRYNQAIIHSALFNKAWSHDCVILLANLWYLFFQGTFIDQHLSNRCPPIDLLRKTGKVGQKLKSDDACDWTKEN